MSSHKWFFLLGCFLFTLPLGCGDGGGIVQPDSGAAADIVSDLSGPADAGQEDTAIPIEEDTAEVTGSECAPGEGCFGEPCDENSDCLSEICTTHMGEKVCSKTCDASCPDGWSCTLTADGGDSQYVCVSNFSTLCLPCSSADGCMGSGPGVCVNYPNGMSFCGGSCGLETPCPEGYGCQEVTNTSGGTSFQCIPNSGVCACSALAVSLGMSSPCSVENDIGTCTGVRVCSDEGLGECDAAIPSVEVCDGIDNDCNGLIDDATCDDGNACTNDICQGEAGCAYEALDKGECLDGDACTQGDHCEAGECVGDPILCADDNGCTDDGCDAETGCQYVANNADCDDGEPCTVGDTCKAGECASGVEVNCDDGNPCTDDACSDSGCVFTDNEVECDDQNACTQTSTCQQGACVGLTAVDCDDQNDCTTDACHPATGCTAVENTLPCNDGDACTLGDACASGECQAGQQAPACTDGNPCTDDACDPVVGCVFSPNQNACDDKNSCTTSDACVNGACLGTGSLGCDDGNPCTVDSCLTEDGCSHIPTDGACDDGDACTINDKCVEGACQSGASPSCDDGNPCTDESCVGGDCVFTPNASDCDDGNPCTTASVCDQGACKGTEAINCDDGEMCTQDHCTMANGCENTPFESPCEDGSICTLGDTCVGGSCASGEDMNCDDGNVCTDDACDPASGCVFTPNVQDCEDGSLCTVGDACSEGACVPGDSLVCDDENSCTDDACDPAQGCVYQNADLGTTTCGKGACEHTVDICQDGDVQVCDPMEGAGDEICDGVDNNCDGEVDEGFLDSDEDGDADCVDLDDDGDGEPDQTDCDPLDPEVNPGAEEICNNGLDDDCNPGTSDVCLLPSCFDILKADPNAASGDYTVDVTGGDPDDAFVVTCDMTTDGGGWNVVNDAQVINVASRHAYKEHVFSVSSYGYPSNVYQFEQVHVNFKFAGELDDPGIFVKSYFNAVEISTFNNGLCNVGLAPVLGWPRTETVNGTSFKLASQPGGDVDADCGNGQPSGINEFSLLRFRIVAQ